MTAPDHRCHFKASKGNGNCSAIDILVPLQLSYTPLPHSSFAKIQTSVVQLQLQPQVSNLKSITMAPTNTRSCSISSASTTSSKSSNDGIKKKFGCTFPNCGKSFSRSEHLHRHALNHKDGNNTCLRCSAHFRRRDLLGMFTMFNRHRYCSELIIGFRQTHDTPQGKG